MGQKMIDSFIESNGTLQDWDGDRAEWKSAMGFYFEGWLACQKAAEQSVHLTALRRVSGVSLLLNTILLIVIAIIGGR